MVVEGDRVALKVIHQHLAGDPQIRGRFTREAAILRRLQGRCVCPVLEFGELPDPRREGVGLLYLVLARVEGPAFDVALRAPERMRIARVCEILLDVCEALGEAHAQGVIHRDLKPGNVLLRDGGHAVVVDFGMAKIVTGGGMGTTAVTQHNMVFGTPEYMAPEQARGDELDARCDIYAAGVVLYEALTGSVPSSGRTTPHTVLTAHLTAVPDKPSARAPEREIPPALEAVVLHAIAKDPAADRQYLDCRGARDGDPRVGGGAERPRGGATGVARPRPRHDTARRARPDCCRGQPSPRPLSRRPKSAPPSAPPTGKWSWGWVAICAAAALAGIALGAWLSTGGR